MRKLAAKGLTEVIADSDLVVMYHVATDQQKSINWQNYGGWGRFGGAIGSAKVDTIVTGQLMVDVADAQGKAVSLAGDRNRHAIQRPTEECQED